MSIKSVGLLSGGLEGDYHMNTEKLNRLQSIIREYGRVVVSYSGGVDSTLLLKVCCETLGQSNVIAVTGVSQTYTSEEKKNAEFYCNLFGVEHIILHTDELACEEFSKNPSDRCYYCKKELYGKIRSIARQRNIDTLVDATNADDLSDYRPGRAAAGEYGVKSPLVDAEFTKKDIREISQMFGLETWDKPANPCLASRVPYGTRITEPILNQIYQAEKYLRSFGFPVIRIRHHNECARIEIPEEYFIRLLDFFKDLRHIAYLKKLGYSYITLDLEGYRSGSLNEVLQ